MLKKSTNIDEKETQLCQDIEILFHSLLRDTDEYIDKLIIKINELKEIIKDLNGIYIGSGNFIHAPQTGDVIKISKVTRFYAARRLL